ncbi:MAG: S1 family peptidase [Anaerolineae bacterium]
MNRKRLVFVIGLVVVLTLFWGSQAGQAIGRAPTKDVSSSVVLLIAADEGRGGRLIPKWSGAGTIISPDGLILTNCQVAFPKAVWDDPEFDYDLLIVLLAQDKPPYPAYLGEVAQYDAALDLAVVRIVQSLDGTPVDPKKLNLPALSVGDSDGVAVGDTLSVWGYDGAGVHAAKPTEVQVDGFVSGRGIKGRAWISVSPELEGQLSGSPALNKDNELVAVAAVGAAGSADDVVHCRYTKDTNGNGTLDTGDTCTATGSISAVRPVNPAQALIRAAGQKLAPQPTPAPTPKRIAPTGPKVGRMVFAPDIDEWEQPVTVVQSLPSGPGIIYFFFDYANFADGAPWQPVLVYDGERREDVWPAQKWEGGPQGTWWISLSDDLPDGTYEFIITYEGEDLASATIEVGGPEEDYPTFANIVFSGGGEEGYLLPGGIREIVATFDYANMTRDTEWSYIGYYEGKKIAEGKGRPFSRASGATRFP